MITNGYELTKFFYNELETNPVLQENCKPAHVSLFFWIIELQNQIGWGQHTIGLPTSSAMNHSCIGNDKTYGKTIEDLVSWGMIIEVCKSVNQNQSRKISLQTEKLKKYLTQRDLAKKETAPVKTTEATPKQVISTDDSSEETTVEATTEALPSYKTDKQDKPAKPNKSINGKTVNGKELTVELLNQIEYEFYKNTITDKEVENRFIKLNKDKNWELTEKNIADKVQRFVSNMKENELKSTKRNNPNELNPLIQREKHQTRINDSRDDVTTLIFDKHLNRDKVNEIINQQNWMNPTEKEQMMALANQEFERFNKTQEPIEEPTEQDDTDLPF